MSDVELLLLMLTGWLTVTESWLFSCTHKTNASGRSCSVFCQCPGGFHCEAFTQTCKEPSKYRQRCHLTRPCAKGLSCHPILQTCLHAPRRLNEPCSFFFPCGKGLSCHPMIQICYDRPRLIGQPCSFAFPCKTGLQCMACADQLISKCQLAQVAPFQRQDYNRRLNEVALLVAHNAFSFGSEIAPLFRNQDYDLFDQLNSGVRGFMFDIYPGWGKEKVRLCHRSCFFGGSRSLTSALNIFTAFLNQKPKEILLIIFEDYVRDPDIVQEVFKDSGLSPFVYQFNARTTAGGFEWPRLRDMLATGSRVLVLSSVARSQAPYTGFRMWDHVLETQYGSQSKTKKDCGRRLESRQISNVSAENHLLLINWFDTLPNPLAVCMNNYDDMKAKVLQCEADLGSLANLVAVDYFERGKHGGVFRLIDWLNQRWRSSKATKQQSFTSRQRIS